MTLQLILRSAKGSPLTAEDHDNDCTATMAAVNGNSAAIAGLQETRVAIGSIGAASGVASLDSGGKLPVAQLTAHTHPQSEIADLPAALAAKQDKTADAGEWSWIFPGTTLADGTLTLLRKPSIAVTITGVSYATASGTATLAVKISGTAITGLDALAASSTPADTAATAANALGVTDTLELVTSSGSTPTDTDITVHWSRA